MTKHEKSTNHEKHGNKRGKHKRAAGTHRLSKRADVFVSDRSRRGDGNVSERCNGGDLNVNERVSNVHEVVLYRHRLWARASKSCNKNKMKLRLNRITVQTWTTHFQF